MTSVYIKTYGCQMNERDSEAVAAQLVAKGYSLAPSEATADVILLNTCSVRDLAEQKALRAKQTDPDEPLVIEQETTVMAWVDANGHDRFDGVNNCFWGTWTGRVCFDDNGFGHNDGRFIAGGQVGYNYQIGQYVWGIEGQISAITHHNDDGACGSFVWGTVHDTLFRCGNRGDWIATASAALEAQERRAEALAAQETELQGRLAEMSEQERMQGAALRQLDARASELEARAAELEAERRRLAAAEAKLAPRIAALDERGRSVGEREQEAGEAAGRNAAGEERLGRRAAKLAQKETELARRLRDVREQEQRLARLDVRAQQLDERALELERTAAELDERGAWLTEAVARVEAREVDVADRERHAVAAEARLARQEEELELRVAALDDRDRRLGEQEEALAERRRRLREEELRLHSS